MFYFRLSFSWERLMFLWIPPLVMGNPSFSPRDIPHGCFNWKGLRQASWVMHNWPSLWPKRQVLRFTGKNKIKLGHKVWTKLPSFVVYSDPATLARLELVLNHLIKILVNTTLVNNWYMGKRFITSQGVSGVSTISPKTKDKGWCGLKSTVTECCYETFPIYHKMTNVL